MVCWLLVALSYRRVVVFFFERDHATIWACLFWNGSSSSPCLSGSFGFGLAVATSFFARATGPDCTEKESALSLILNKVDPLSSQPRSNRLSLVRLAR